MKGIGVLLLTAVLGLSLGCAEQTADGHVAAATEALAERDLGVAVIELKNALQLDPEHAEARFLLGSAHLETGDIDSAIKELRRALDLGVASDRVLPELFTALLAVGDHAQVLGGLEAFAALTPVLTSLKGRALVQSGDLEAAEMLLREALARDPALADAAVALSGIVLSRDGDVEQAMRLLVGAVEAEPHNRSAWLTRADLETQTGDLTAAEASLTRAAELPGIDLLPQIGLIRVAVLQGRLDAAQTILTRYLAAAPKHVLLNYYQGVVAYRQGDFPRAQNALRVVQSVAADHPQTLLVLGATDYRLESYAQAAYNLQRYLAIEPSNVFARKVLAASRMAQGDAVGAIAALETVAGALEDSEGLELLAAAHLAEREFEQATTYLERAAALDPDSADLRTRLALAMIGSGDMDAAIGQLEAGIQLADASADRSEQDEVLLVLVMLQEGRVEEALELGKALSVNQPDSPIGYHLQGKALRASGDLEAATGLLEQALALQPAYSPATRELVGIAMGGDDIGAAMGRYLDLLKADPTNLGGLTGVAQMALANGETESALQYLEEARNHHEFALEPRIALARVALLLGDHALAKQVIDEAADLAPTNPVVAELEALVAIASSNGDVARRAVNRLDRLLGPDAAPEEYFKLGRLQYQIGQVRNAHDSLSRAVDLTGDPAVPLATLLEVNLALGDLAAAEANLATLKELDVPVVSLAVLEGDVNLYRNNYDAAARQFRTALQANAANAAAVRKLGAALGELDAGSDHKAWFVRFTDGRPDDFEAWLSLAELEQRHGNLPAAVRRYEHLVARWPDAVIPLNNLAWLQLGEDRQRALELARRARALDSETPEIADTLGWILVATGSDLKEAVANLEFALERRPGNATIQYHLAEAYRAQGKTAEARRLATAALESGPFPEAEASRRLLSEGVD